VPDIALETARSIADLAHLRTVPPAIASRL
jgi:hypothetical protein